LARDNRRAIPYISILEFHESGLPHLHILLDRYIPQAWISESWAALGGGKVVWIKRVIDLHRISSYLSKYLTKNLILSAPWGTRRWTTSRGIKLMGRKKAPGWKHIRTRFNVLYRLLENDAVTVESTKDGHIRFFTVKEGVIEF
jgi:hypothetical protein